MNQFSIKSQKSPNISTALRYYFDVIYVLVLRDFQGRYRDTTAGIVWSLASPLLYLLIFYFVFKVGFRVRTENYASFVLIGIIAWMWTSTALNEATRSITGNAALVSQPAFPTITLPLVACLTAMIDFLIILPILLLVILFDRGGLPATFGYAFAIMIVQVFLLLSLSLFLAAANVGFRDTRYILPIFLQLGYYITPIFYDVSMVPPEYHLVYELNPMYHIISAYRDVMLDGRPPDWTVLAVILGISLLLFGGGARFFEGARESFLEELS